MALLERRSAGFTLIELMVVISIAAILIALGTVSYTTAQKKARDSKRRGDMKAVSGAFEQYYSVNGEYDSTSSGCATIGADGSVLPAGLPSDPKPNWTAYSYACAGSTYCNCARLENENANSDDGACAFDNSGDEEYFCVINQQ